MVTTRNRIRVKFQVMVTKVKVRVKVTARNRDKATFKVKVGDRVSLHEGQGNTHYEASKFWVKAMKIEVSYIKFSLCSGYGYNGPRYDSGGHFRSMPSDL